MSWLAAGAGSTAQPSTFLVLGDAGAGKSALVRAFASAVGPPRPPGDRALGCAGCGGCLRYAYIAKVHPEDAAAAATAAAAAAAAEDDDEGGPEAATGAGAGGAAGGDAPAHVSVWVANRGAPPDALALAVPSPRDLERTAVAIVLDGGAPSRMPEALAAWLAVVAALVRRAAPGEEERSRLVDTQRRHWRNYHAAKVRARGRHAPVVAV